MIKFEIYGTISGVDVIDSRAKDIYHYTCNETELNSLIIIVSSLSTGKVNINLFTDDNGTKAFTLIPKNNFGEDFPNWNIFRAWGKHYNFSESITIEGPNDLEYHFSRK